MVVVVAVGGTRGDIQVTEGDTGRHGVCEEDERKGCVFGGQDLGERGQKLVTVGSASRRRLEVELAQLTMLGGMQGKGDTLYEGPQLWTTPAKLPCGLGCQGTGYPWHSALGLQGTGASSVSPSTL